MIYFISSSSTMTHLNTPSHDTVAVKKVAQEKTINPYNT